MNGENRIVVNPEILVGKPIIQGTRISVEFIIDLLAEGWSHQQVLENYPQITDDDIQASLCGPFQKS
ncbi:MAG: DUF433 domain-containing protein [Planctomycetota bacterium]|nr:DUF433 domain-containing protein [Planctomycetota bacterium]